MTSRPTRPAVVVGGTLALTLVLASCSGPSAETTGDEPVNLTLSTFGNFGYTDELIAEFEDQYPNISVTHNIAANGGEARTSLFTKLAAGSGLADVEGIEIGWTVDLAQYADQFVPVPSDEEYGPWLDYQADPVTTEDGELFAYGVAGGPSAVCYRTDLFEAAGLPTDRDEVAELLDGDWANYFAVGEQFTAASDAAWFDSAVSIYEGIIEQFAYPFEDESGEIVATTNPEVRDSFEQALEAAPELSAKLGPFSDDWFTAMTTGEFATMLCPSWMMGIIEGSAPEATTWDVANVFPNGGGNRGGSYLAVPTQSEHPEEAALLASWLTAPEQQISAFQVAGPFPSRVAALDLADLQGISSEYFGGAPTGEIFIERSEAVDVVAYKGEKFYPILTAISDALLRVESGSQSVDDAWSQFVQEVEAL